MQVIVRSPVKVEPGTDGLAIARRFDCLVDVLIWSVGCWVVLVFAFGLTKVVQFGAGILQQPQLIVPHAVPVEHSTVGLAFWGVTRAQVNILVRV